MTYVSLYLITLRTNRIVTKNCLINTDTIPDQRIINSIEDISTVILTSITLRVYSLYAWAKASTIYDDLASNISMRTVIKTYVKIRVIIVI